MSEKEAVTMRTEFPEHQISKLPKPTKAQTDEVKADFKAGVRCHICGGWHHPKVVHLDYVGHAALTDRLLDVDPSWNWEPFALDSNGLPAIDKDGGMWIRLTVLGVTRPGYGDAQGKSGGDAMKERIGDALRNAAMRFGAALNLWHKGELHLDEPEKSVEKPLVTESQIADLLALAQEVKANMTTFIKFLGVKKIQDLPAAELPRAIAALESKRTAKQPEDIPQ
jgi:hypothetical protein